MNRSNGYKTKQRELILQYFEVNSDKHVTAEELICQLKENGTPVGKSTVYRYLDLLIKQDLIRKYKQEEGAGACYQLNQCGEHCREHYHFKCDVCGDLFHVECEQLNGFRNHILKEHNFNIDTSKTVFYGTCDKCKGAEQ